MGAKRHLNGTSKVNTQTNRRTDRRTDRQNQNAEVAIKTSSGTTERTTIKNIIMQGTVWGSLFCTASMDKLPKLQYENEDILYKYKGSVSVPSLEMVDDIVDVKKCGIDSLKSHATINTFIEHKKVTMEKQNTL